MSSPVQLTRRAAALSVLSAAAMSSGAEAAQGVLTGLDVMALDQFRALSGKRIVLVTNQTGVDREGRRNLDLMLGAGIDVRAVLTPEHGFAAAIDDAFIDDARDPSSGVPIHSLFTEQSRRPHPDLLRGLDGLVFDMADVGARFYTYTTTLGYVLEAAAEQDLPVHVLDRPNPVTGRHVEGPMLDRANISFVGYAELPVRHGMTIGELATLFNASIGASLHVTSMTNWRRGMWFDETGLQWINPSPNMRNWRAALLYPGLALLELDPNYSVGRGTALPFEQIGTEYIDASRLAEEMTALDFSAVRVAPVEFTPTSNVLAGRIARGLRFEIVNRDRFNSTAFGLSLASTIDRLHPGRIDFDENRLLIGDDEILEALKNRRPLREILALSRRGVDAFERLRRLSLLY